MLFKVQFLLSYAISYTTIPRFKSLSLTSPCLRLLFGKGPCECGVFCCPCSGNTVCIPPGRRTVLLAHEFSSSLHSHSYSRLKCAYGVCHCLAERCCTVCFIILVLFFLFVHMYICYRRLQGRLPVAAKCVTLSKYCIKK